ncbi:hypothetical protein [Thermanaeromonas sp. C210]|uniref:hypothetical protein n=1 Tax=Thermanaeromonas sp. C210 TaxID=2731925 RepID=UPI00155CB439|nr:hypothetical protein [Thermanaeromonas sp. C210]GFN21836.1 hypothetical protein TAMC210_01520 [Thermanaeromonas sp. C210]
MRQKIGTALSPRLLYKAKLVAKSKKKPVNAIIEEALEQYLYKNKNKKTGEEASVVRSTRGSIPAQAEVVRKILEEEDFVEV